jgi:hypothetical protein
MKKYPDSNEIQKIAIKKLKGINSQITWYLSNDSLFSVFMH